MSVIATLKNTDLKGPNLTISSVSASDQVNLPPPGAKAHSSREAAVAFSAFVWKSFVDQTIVRNFAKEHDSMGVIYAQIISDKLAKQNVGGLTKQIEKQIAQEAYGANKMGK